MNYQGVEEHIVAWLKDYLNQSGLQGFIIGISGGIDSAVTSTLCAKTGAPVICLNMPIRQKREHYRLAAAHISDLEQKFPNVSSFEIELSSVFSHFENALPKDVASDQLSMANSRSRLRMMTLYAIGQTNRLLVAGTGNKVEDFGVGFYTKYGDGGVDLSPIADLMKTQVYTLGEYMGVIDEILNSPPTDGLWEDDRTDEDQIGATYPELEWAMEFNENGQTMNLSERQQEVLNIYKKLNTINKHKMVEIPVCFIPEQLK